METWKTSTLPVPYLRCAAEYIVLLWRAPTHRSRLHTFTLWRRWGPGPYLSYVSMEVLRAGTLPFPYVNGGVEGQYSLCPLGQWWLWGPVPSLSPMLMEALRMTLPTPQQWILEFQNLNEFSNFEISTLNLLHSGKNLKRSLADIIFLAPWRHFTYLDSVNYYISITLIYIFDKFWKSI